MDFGLSRYLEMFEERFGRRATTGLILFITAGLIAVICPLIWKNLWEPIYGALVSVASGKSSAYFADFSWGDFFAFLGSGITSLGAVVIVAALVRIQFDTKYQLEMRRMNKLRRVAMTGPVTTANKIAKRRLRIFLAVTSTAVGAVAIIYLSIVATGDKIQLNALEPQVNADIAKKDKLLKQTDQLHAEASATSKNLSVLKLHLDALEKRDNELRGALAQICKKSPAIAATCKVTLAATVHDDFEGLPALPHPAPNQKD